jgi:hypothetical protein
LSFPSPQKKRPHKEHPTKLLFCTFWQTRG